MKKIIITNQPWQTRVAIMHGDVLENIYFWSRTKASLERAYFKGVVTKVLPGIQTAFVDIGQTRAGFLHISEIDRELALNAMRKNVALEDDEEERTAEVEVEGEQEKKSYTHYQPRDISKIFTEGQEILVQVSKEPMYEKGPKLTTCFTLPGRFVVLMPNIPRIGVSKKIEAREERIRLKEIVRANIEPSMGAIIRTTAENCNENDLKKDLAYLIEEWREIEAAFAKSAAKAKLHDDLPLPLQIVRDHLDQTVSEVLTDDENLQKQLYKFVRQIASEHTQKILLQKDVDLFSLYNIDKQIERALQAKVTIKSGASLIIETTEAMTVIDVNTGRFTGKSNLEETIFKTNLEAADEIVRQIKLRNIGGLIVIDFIDMKSNANKQRVFSYLDQLLKERDRFQSVVLRISEFGLVQMTRKRSGKSLILELTEQCALCHGSGHVRSRQSESYVLFRQLQHQLSLLTNKSAAVVELSADLFPYITSKEFDAILAIEKATQKKLTLVSNPMLHGAAFRITAE
jgi:ribonuclease G